MILNKELNDDKSDSKLECRNVYKSDLKCFMLLRIGFLKFKNAKILKKI